MKELSNDIVKTKRNLEILVTENDKTGNNIAEMSNFFDVYIHQLSNEIKGNSLVEAVADIPASNIGIISEVLNGVDIIMDGGVSYIPDFDHLPDDIKTKYKQGIYTVGESRQVDGNARAVILDENGVRIKDITLKKVQNQVASMEAIRSITTQMQLRQIYGKLETIESYQEYQIERDRDRDIVVPFLNARHYILLAQESESEEYRINQLDKANEEMTKALNAVYTELNTTANHLVKLTSRPVFQRRKQIETFMRYIASDLQLATKYVGVQMHIYDYLGNKKAAEIVLQSYQRVMKDFVNKSIGKKGQTTANLLQMNYPYNEDNMDFWFNFSREIQPVINANNLSDVKNEDIYLISVEDD